MEESEEEEWQAERGEMRSSLHVVFSGVILLGVVDAAINGLSRGGSAAVGMRTTAAIKLPAPREESGVSLERALRERRSTRKFRSAALTVGEIAQLLWAAQGVTSSAGLRTAPSAGALFPLEVYVVAGAIESVDAGVYRYVPAQHALMHVASDDRRRDLARAAFGQESVATAPAVLVLAAVEHRTTKKYGERGVRYVLIEAGHVSQNVLLQATALGLGAVPIGAFDDARVTRALGLPEDEKPLYLIALGRLSPP